MAVQPQGARPLPTLGGAPLYHVAQNRFETFLALRRNDWEGEHISPLAEPELHRYLECDILAYSFARE